MSNKEPGRLTGRVPCDLVWSPYVLPDMHVSGLFNHLPPWLNPTGSAVPKNKALRLVMSTRPNKKRGGPTGNDATRSAACVPTGPDMSKRPRPGNPAGRQPVNRPNPSPSPAMTRHAASCGPGRVIANRLRRAGRQRPCKGEPTGRNGRVPDGRQDKANTKRLWKTGGNHLRKGGRAARE